MFGWRRLFSVGDLAIAALLDPLSLCGRIRDSGCARSFSAEDLAAAGNTIESSNPPYPIAGAQQLALLARDRGEDLVKADLGTAEAQFPCWDSMFRLLRGYHDSGVQTMGQIRATTPPESGLKCIQRPTSSTLYGSKSIVTCRAPPFLEASGHISVPPSALVYPKRLQPLQPLRRQGFQVRVERDDLSGSGYRGRRNSFTSGLSSTQVREDLGSRRSAGHTTDQIGDRCAAAGPEAVTACRPL